jgi:hypothetical protein
VDGSTKSGLVAASVQKTGDGVFLLFVIGISSLIRHSDFLIRHCFAGLGFDPRVFLVPQASRLQLLVL